MDTKKIVFCLQDHALHNDDRGTLTPIFEQLGQDFKAITIGDFPNNGKIHVTKGYSNVVSNTKPSTLFRVEADVALNWPPEQDLYGRTSKYSTYEKKIERAPANEIFQIYESKYPDPSAPNGLTCESKTYPMEYFFIQSRDSNDRGVLIGPVALVTTSVTSTESGYLFDYKGIDKPFGTEWAKIKDIPHSALVFELDLVPDTCLLSTDLGLFIVNALPQLAANLIDLSSNESLLKWASNLLRKNRSELSEKTNLLKSISTEINDDTNIPDEVFLGRKKRLKDLHERMAKMEGFSEVVIDFLASSDGEKRIENYVNANRDSLLKKYLDEQLKTKSAEIEEKLEQETKRLEQEVEILAQEEKDLDYRISQLKEDEKNLEQTNIRESLKALREEHNLTMEYIELKGAKIQMDQELSELEKRKSDTQELLEEIQRNINRSHKDHKQNLIELKNQLDVLSGFKENDEIPQILQLKNYKAKTIQSEEKNEQRKEVIETLTKALKDQNRIITKEQVAILITSIMQNLIITLAGKPGSGKTSMVNSLSSVLGLNTCGRFVDIQVQRGWSSDKEIVGFQNKLTRNYEPDKYGLYKLMTELENLPEDQQLAFALLDEANLSPVEHYWAGFMGATDNSNKLITLDEIKLQLPKGLRFISTVNYDRTTEPLSHRFLDRSPVVYLDEHDEMDELLESKEQVTETKAVDYSFNDLNLLFGRDSEANFSSDERRILEELLLDHKVLPLRNRKINAIRQFTYVFRNTFIYSSGQLLQALDYAILIHALPLISGQGQELRFALTSLHDYLHDRGLSKSSNRLQEIIQNGRFDSYSFFS